MTDFSFYWHDYETFGADPAKDRPSQFAGIRTDGDFNVIGEPLVIYCQPQRDILPHPEACLITGITPQHALKEGVCEAEFIRQIHNEFAQPGTCAAGYNSIRFDDEVSRYTLYRNFYDPYEREWKNGNSRWDLIDMVRVCCALRPEGINWPKHEDGSPSFKLEDLTKANGISHEAAHDALSDVYATIAMAKLIKQKQAKLFDYLFKLRNKREVSAMLDVASKAPVLHTSAMFPANRFCTTLVMPLAIHPVNKNGVICYDLSVDPTALIELDADTIRKRIYTSTADLPEGVERLALKTIHTNRCPVVATSKLLDEEIAERVQLDLSAARKNYIQLKNSKGLAEKLQEVFADVEFPEKNNPDLMLYSGGFFSAADKQQMAQVRASSAAELAEYNFTFEDQRLPEMLFRYRARNYPESLNEQESLQWQEHCFQHLTEATAENAWVMDEYLAVVDTLLSDQQCSERDKVILQKLLDYSDALLS